MTYTHGKNFGVKWNAASITACIDSGSFERLIEFAETTHSSVTNPVYKTRLAGLVDLKVSVGGPYDGTVLANLEADWLAGTERVLKVQPDATGVATTSAPSYSFSALCENIKLDTSVSDKWTWSGDFSLSSGPLTRDTSSAF